MKGCSKRLQCNGCLSLQEAALAAETLKRGAELADAAQPRLAIYNTDALHDKLEDISWTTEQPWEETQVCSSKHRLSSTWLNTSRAVLQAVLPSAASSRLVLAFCTGSTRGATRLPQIRLASLLQVILHGDVTEVTNIDDDLSRELAFYTQVSVLLSDAPLATAGRYLHNLDSARPCPCPS